MIQFFILVFISPLVFLILCKISHDVEMNSKIKKQRKQREAIEARSRTERESMQNEIEKGKVFHCYDIVPTHLHSLEIIEYSEWMGYKLENDYEIQYVKGYKPKSFLGESLDSRRRVKKEIIKVIEYKKSDLFLLEMDNGQYMQKKKKCFALDKTGSKYKITFLEDITSTRNNSISGLKRELNY